MDNKCVKFGTTFAGVSALHIDVKCPDIVSFCNQSTEGIDLADMLIPLYRTNIKLKQWY